MENTNIKDKVPHFFALLFARLLCGLWTQYDDFKWRDFSQKMENYDILQTVLEKLLFFSNFTDLIPVLILMIFVGGTMVRKIMKLLIGIFFISWGCNSILSIIFWAFLNSDQILHTYPCENLDLVTPFLFFRANGDVYLTRYLGLFLDYKIYKKIDRSSLYRYKLKLYEETKDKIKMFLGWFYKFLSVTLGLFFVFESLKNIFFMLKFTDVFFFTSFFDKFQTMESEKNSSGTIGSWLLTSKVLKNTCKFELSVDTILQNCNEFLVDFSSWIIICFICFYNFPAFKQAFIEKHEGLEISNLRTAEKIVEELSEYASFNCNMWRFNIIITFLSGYTGSIIPMVLGIVWHGFIQIYYGNRLIKNFTTNRNKIFEI